MAFCLVVPWLAIPASEPPPAETYTVMRYTRHAPAAEATPGVRAYVKIATRPADNAIDLVVESDGQVICSDVMQAGTAKVKRRQAVRFYLAHGRN